jgi:stearoyl-CoA desaturase (delta-9 desaturase)
MKSTDFLFKTIEPKFALGIDHKVTSKQLWRETWRSINVFKDRKNWLSFFNFLTLVLSGIGGLSFLIGYFEWPYFFMAVFISSIPLNVFGTLYYHRYTCHKVYQVNGTLSHWLIKNLAPRLFSEETFFFTHLIHHKYSDGLNDPHRLEQGWWFSLAADFNQMRTNTQLSAIEYARCLDMFSHVRIPKNNYKEYLKYGTLTKPLHYIIEVLFNWLLWSVLFYVLGGASALGGFYLACFFWGFFGRNFNFKAHGGGQDKRKAHRDFDDRSLALNLELPGYFAGEWHAHHHVFPTSANNGFLWYQTDLTFTLIRLLKLFGLVSRYNDQTALFQEYLIKRKNMAKSQVDSRT